MKAAGGIKFANLAKKIVTQLAISCNNHVTETCDSTVVFGIVEFG